VVKGNAEELQYSLSGVQVTEAPIRGPYGERGGDEKKAQTRAGSGSEKPGKLKRTGVKRPTRTQSSYPKGEESSKDSGIAKEVQDLRAEEGAGCVSGAKKI